MNIPCHERPTITSTLELSPAELGTLTLAVLSCLDTADALNDEEYRATLLTLRDRLLTLIGMPEKPEME